MTRALATALFAYLALWATLLHIDFAYRDLCLLISATALFAVAVALLARARLSARRCAALIIVVGGLLQVIALTRSPLTSDDAYRYLWDAKVQLDGIDPYRFVPWAPQLAHLRDGYLFGPQSTCVHAFTDGCTAINRPGVHTVYPPVAQGAFVLARLAAFGGHGGLLSFQIFAALGSLAVAALLVRRALKRGTAMWPVALWAWCPVIVSEFGNNAHIDWLAVLLTVLAMQARRDLVAGGLVGAAFATKLYPALVLPALMRRRPWVVPLTALAVVVLVYIPHLLAVGRGVIGFLPQYLQTQGYNSGSRFLLLGAVLPHPLDTVAGVAILAAVALWARRHTDPSAPEHAATIMTGTAFLVVTPPYGWYAPILIALAIMSARYEWIVLAIAPSLLYLVHGDITHWSSPTIYLVGALGTAFVWFRRGRGRSHRAGPDYDTRPSSQCDPSPQPPSHRYPTQIAARD